MTDPLPQAPSVDARVVDARLHLLDRQVLDVEGDPVATVDDLEIADLQYGERLPDRPAPTISALISGPILTTRLFGGRTPPGRLQKIGWDLVADLDIVFTLEVKSESLEVTWFERWLASRVIGRIPGGDHDPE
ncbi:hypothetical protein [Amnibacterium sp.]|uniref:hypothetical protein n=1 Tax=Amnibacterium sp. TaxID=1872496 RepID=UPI002608B998|nr:hypothetical protein [Amnibacterium sp.]MCU1473682.1 hypothetical protein [Amnibacterium sp.]